MPEPLPRRPKGSGSITHYRGNKFRASIRIPDGFGEQKQTVKYFDSYIAADDWLSSVIGQKRRLVQATGGDAPPARLVSDLLRHWLESKYRENQLSGKPDIGVLQDYDTIAREYIVKHLGAVPLEQLTSRHIEQWQDIVAAHVSTYTKKKLSNDRKRIIWVVLTQSVRWGVHRGYLLSDPTAGIKAFKSKKTDPRRRTMSDEDYRKFITYLNDHPCDHLNKYCRLRWLVAIYLGRREGEVLGLAYSNVDLKKATLQVNNRLKARTWLHGCEPNENNEPSCGKSHGGFCPKRHGGGLVLLEGTKAGSEVKPEIPIGGLVPYFKEHKKAHDAERVASKKAGTYSPNPAHTDLIFTQPLTMRAFDTQSDNRRFKHVLKEAGVTTHYGIHQLRHTSATRMSDATGGNLPVIMSILGHKTVSTTMLYVAPDMKARQKALDALMKDALAVQMNQN